MITHTYSCYRRLNKEQTFLFKFWMVLSILSIGFVFPFVSNAQTLISVGPSSFDQFSVTLPENPSSGQVKHIRLAGPLSTVTVRATRCDSVSPCSGPNGTFSLASPVTILSGASSIATLVATEDLADQIWHLRIVATNAVPAGGEQWEIQVENSGATAIDVRWMAGDVSDDTLESDVVVSPTSLNFGDVMVGDTATLLIEVSNLFTQSTPLAIALQTGGQGFSIINTGDIPATLDPMTTVPVEISFTPSVEAVASDDLTITTVDPDSASITLALSGNGVVRRLVLTLDASSSMWCEPIAVLNCPNAGPASRLAQVKNALEPFLNELEARVQSLISSGKIPGVKIGVVKFQNSSAGVIHNLSDVGATDIFVIKGNIGVPYASGTGIQPNGGTPIDAGLTTSLGLFPAGGTLSTTEGVIFLLSDGRSSLPDPLASGNSVSSIETREIKVYSLAYGDETSGSYYVDHALLSAISSRTDGDFLVYAPGGVINSDLSAFFAKLFDVALGTNTANDPIGNISSGETKEHLIPVSPSDRRVSFVLAWDNEAANFLGLDLIAPDETVISPVVAQQNPFIQYRSGSRSTLYLIDDRYLSLEGKTGIWKMRVSFSQQQSHATGISNTKYTYNSLVATDLKLDVKFNKASYFTNDKVRIEATLTDRGKPILGADVKLNAASPDKSMGNWYAEHIVSEKEYAKIPQEAIARENYSKVVLKGHILTEIKKLSPPVLVKQNGIKLYDDATHGDQVSGDGIYTYESEPLNKTGVHTYYITANGNDHRGHQFKREKRQDKYVNLRPAIDFSAIHIAMLAERENGVIDYEVKVELKDKFGNLMPPGASRNLELEVAANKLGGIIDNVDGTYSQKIQVSAGDKPQLTITANGVALNPVVVTPPTSPIPWWVWVMVILLIIVIIIMVKRNGMP
ncbi:MAG: hypothetical protein BBJ57_14025 [Desulfobacterales bacterium PC51MH44]|nr:MAG: hypothetical protein BBJ57_14025 [Desulfobacterales bacterium PC51MH44]